MPPHSEHIKAFQQLVVDTLEFLKGFPPGQSLFVSPSAANYFKLPAKPPPPPKKIVEKRIGPPLQKPIPPPIASLKKEMPEKMIAPIKPLALPSPEPSIKLEPLKSAANDPMKEIEEIVKKAVPQLKIVSTIPSDDGAKRISTIWEEKSGEAAVVLLLFQETDQEIAFLKNLAKAIDVHLTPAKMLDAIKLEKGKKWDLFLNNSHMKLIIASAETIQKYPELKKHYKEDPSSSACYLGKIPLLPLAPFSSYFKEPQLKRSLWHKLCQIVNS